MNLNCKSFSTSVSIQKFKRQIHPQPRILFPPAPTVFFFIFDYTHLSSLSTGIFCFVLYNEGNTMSTNAQGSQDQGDAPPKVTCSDKKHSAQCECSCHHQISALPKPKPKLDDSACLTFTLIPEGNIKLNIPVMQGDWLVKMSFAVQDMSNLMRDGLYWTPDNILRHESKCYVDYNTEPAFREAGFTCSRHYTYGDRSCFADRSPKLGWVGKMTVFARRRETLAQFRVGDLSPEMIVYA